jgi:hypothetical protein
MPNDLGAHVAAEVSRSEADYQNVRNRALSLIGVSGGVVALVSGLLAIAAGTTKVTLPASAKWTAGAALVAFVLSTVCALITNNPGNVVASKVSGLRELVDSHWDDEGWDQQVASILVDYLDSLRANNASTANWLQRSIGCQMVGIALIATTAILILTNAH